MGTVAMVGLNQTKECSRHFTLSTLFLRAPRPLPRGPMSPAVNWIQRASLFAHNSNPTSPHIFAGPNRSIRGTPLLAGQSSGAQGFRVPSRQPRTRRSFLCFRAVHSGSRDWHNLTFTPAQAGTNVKKTLYGKEKMKKEKKEKNKKNGYQSALAEKSRLGLWRSRAWKRRATLPEKTLLEALNAQRYWLKFQPYFYTDTHLFIPDFRLACNNYKLIIEVDGPSHNQQHQYDTARTAWMQANRNCVVLRFSNYDVLNHIEKVLREIETHHPLRMNEDGYTKNAVRANLERKQSQYAQDADPAEQFKRF